MFFLLYIFFILAFEFWKPSGFNCNQFSLCRVFVGEVNTPFNTESGCPSWGSALVKAKEDEAPFPRLLAGVSPTRKPASCGSMWTKTLAKYTRPTATKSTFCVTNIYISTNCKQCPLARINKKIETSKTFQNSILTLKVNFLKMKPPAIVPSG